MKVLFVILLIAAGLIYAGTQGAFKRNSVEKSFGLDQKTSQMNGPQVSSIDGFTMKKDEPKKVEADVSEKTAETKSDLVVGNDESDPYSKHVDDSSTAPVSDFKGISSDSGQVTSPVETTAPKTLFEKIGDAGSLTEVLALLKEAATNSTKQEVTATEKTDTSKNIIGDEIRVTSPSDKDPLLVIQKEVEKEKEASKHTMMVVLPVESQSSEVNNATGTITVKNNSSSSSLLSVCKTKYTDSKDVRIINQVSIFNVATKSVESLTFEVECL